MRHSEPMVGINLGGWLVLEKWMTPSLFEGTSARNEFELSKTKEGRRRITRHHQTFITKKDLVWLKGQGVQILRVPIGYWVDGSDARYVGSLDRLDWLMRTSLSVGLKVLLDLHGAPGAQNRAMHSGSGNTISDKHSTKWLNDASAQAQTIDVLVTVTARYSHYPHLWGVQLLNEPSVDLLGLKLARFYRRAYTAVISVARPGTRIVFSDAYAPLRLTNCLKLHERPDFPVVMDCHIYQVFGRTNKGKSFEAHLRRLKWTKRFLRLMRLSQPVLIGEWSAMLPIRTSPEMTRQYIKAQIAAFSGCEAQMYWSYKTESEGRWNFRDQASKGLLQ